MSLPLIGQETAWNSFKSLIDTPCHIFLTGPAGCGKTTLVTSFLKLYAEKHNRPGKWGTETNDECLILGPEQDRGIQTIRGQVSMFIRQMSLGLDIYRWVVIDDVDTFPQISQQALRRPMESYSHITRFIFVGNSEEDLIPALHSRCIHISMDSINPYDYTPELLDLVNMPHKGEFTEEMWAWILNISGTNISDLIRLLSLIANAFRVNNTKPSVKLIRTLCSAPFYVDFIPLMNALSEKNLVQGTYALIHIWKRGYTFEDILESFQTIHTMFGNSNIYDNLIIHIFLVNAWISYCKGNTSILALQNVYYKTITSEEIPI